MSLGNKNKQIINNAKGEPVQVIGEPPIDRPKNLSFVPITAIYSQNSPLKSYDIHRNQDERINQMNSTRGNNLQRIYVPPPKIASIPKIYIPPPVSQINSHNLLKNRTCNGKILGSYKKRYVDETNVPVLELDYPVGPENPVKMLNDTWSACWDDQAGAVYYYNNITGEATWINPL